MAKRIQHRGRTTVAKPQTTLTVGYAPRLDLAGPARVAREQAAAHVWSNRVQRAMAMDDSVAQAFQQLGHDMAAPEQPAADGECTHSRGSLHAGPHGPNAIWRCDACGWLYRLVDTGADRMTMVAAE